MRLAPSHLLRGVLAAAALTATAVHVDAQVSQPVSADTLASIDALFSRWDTASGPGCVVGADRGGQRLFTRAYGMADLEHGVANTPQTVFNVGSVSKQFTAAAILALVADGEILLDDDVRTYFPEIPDYGETITVDHLLRHTSGLRDWGEIVALTGYVWRWTAYTNEDVLEITARQRALNHPPGDYFSYTNTGYILLGLLIDRVTGQTLPEYTHERFFAPLGMTSTQWNDDYRRVVPRRAAGYVRSGGAYIRDTPDDFVIGSGSLLSTVDDLLRWNEALRTGALGPGITEAMEETVVLDTGKPEIYGRGLFVNTHAGHREVQHGGTTIGYQAWTGRYTESGLSIALLCNLSVGDNVGLGREVMHRLLPGKGASEADVASVVTLTAAQAAARAGVFVSDVNGQLYDFEAEGTRLVHQGEAGVPITPHRIRFGWGDVVYDESLDQMDVDEEFGQGGTWRRVDGSLPTADELAEIAGHYYSPDAAALFEATIESDQLVLRPVGRRIYVMQLRPVGPDMFRSPATVFRVLRDASGRVEALAASRPRLHDLRLDRVALDFAP